MSDKFDIIVGAGPAGLAAAYELIKNGIRPIILEKADKVGGLARTETYQGCHFDIGGHRFFSKIDQINLLWQEILGENFLTVSRLSRIYYEGRFFNYPLRFLNALYNLGVIESLLVLLSYLKSQFSSNGFPIALAGASIKSFLRHTQRRCGVSLAIPSVLTGRHRE
jgi:protoporphyrinogen oxidase